MDRLWYQVPMSNAIATQLIGHDLPRLATMRTQQSPEEPFRCCSIPLRLKIYVDHLTVLVNRPPEIMLFAVDRMVRHTGEDFIDVEAIAIA